MFNGAHIVIFSRDANADRKFFRDVLELPNVDAGDGWLIFRAPPSELAVHPTDGQTAHEFYLMCDDVVATADWLEGKGIECAEVSDEGWGLLSAFTLPGGARIGFYQPRHAKPA